MGNITDHSDHHEMPVWWVIISYFPLLLLCIREQVWVCMCAACSLISYKLFKVYFRSCFSGPKLIAIFGLYVECNSKYKNTLWPLAPCAMVLSSSDDFQFGKSSETLNLPVVLYCAGGPDSCFGHGCRYDQSDCHCLVTTGWRALCWVGSGEWGPKIQTQKLESYHFFTFRCLFLWTKYGLATGGEIYWLASITT